MTDDGPLRGNGPDGGDPPNGGDSAQADHLGPAAPSVGRHSAEVSVRGPASVSTRSQTTDVSADVVDGTGVTRSASTPLRRDARVSRPPRHHQWLINQLPVGMLGSDFFVRFVSIFQEMAETLMDGADQIEHVPDAAVAPTPLLAYLASWIDVHTVDPSLPENVQRVLLRSSARALALRGTARGISEYLRMLSGGPVEVTDGGGVWGEGLAPDDVAWVRMRVTGTGHLSESEFVALVRDEIPAHVRAELYIGERRVLCTEEERK